MRDRFEKEMRRVDDEMQASEKHNKMNCINLNLFSVCGKNLRVIDRQPHPQIHLRNTRHHNPHMVSIIYNLYAF